MKRLSISLATFAISGTLSAESSLQPDCYALRAFQFSEYLIEAIENCHPDQTKVIVAMTERQLKLKEFLLAAHPNGETSLEGRRKNAKLPNSKDCDEAGAEGMNRLIEETDVSLKSWDGDIEYHLTTFPNADWMRCLD